MRFGGKKNQNPAMSSFATMGWVLYEKSHVIQTNT